MGSYILNSNFEIENGEVFERNMHKEIKELISKKNATLIEHLNVINEKIKLFKKEGFEIIYSLKIET